MWGATCYEIEGICYYITSAQNGVLEKLGGPENNSHNIKKWAFASGLKGEPIIGPDGTKATAVIMPEGEKRPEPVVEQEVEQEQEPLPLNLAEESGYHA